jgi:hypothetical protein
MKPDIFLNRIVFRLIAPLLYGSVVYILILLIFDSLALLEENFFSQEILVTIILSYAQFETLLGINLLIEKYWKQSSSYLWRITLVFGLGLILSMLIVSAGIWIYFEYVVGFSTFSSELITFNAIFALSSLLYNLIYISLFFLDKKNEGKMNEETMLRYNLEADLESFKNEVNPELLFDSFESLIGLIHQSKKQADEFIGHLSGFYRYCLQNRNNDLVSIREELKLVDTLIHILNVRYSGQISLEMHVELKNSGSLIVPCTVLSIIEIACRKSIIDQNQPLEITIKSHEKFLSINYPLNKRIKPGSDYSNRIERIKKSYKYFSDTPFEINEIEGMQYINIPLLSLEESEM